jgi:hypothetical protein
MSSRNPAKASVWPVAGLLLLGALPLTFGVLRTLQFAGIVDVMPPVAGGLALPLLLHIGGAALYALLGALQFSAAIRRCWPAWHRVAGRIALAAGAIVGLSALWLTAWYATATLAGIILAGFRIVFSSGLLASLTLGLAAVRRRDFGRHREWMMRAYALALGAATQMIVLMVAEVLMGEPPGDLARSLLMGLAWTINLTFAEWLIRRTRTMPRLAKPAPIPSSGR